MVGPERAVELIRRLNRYLRAGELDEAVGKLTLAQIRVLFRLRNGGEVTSSQLAGGLGVTLPTVTSVVDRLVSQGLVVRTDDPGDRRRVILGITDAGAEIVGRIQEGRRARLVRAVGALTPAEVDHLVAGLEALVTATTSLEVPDTAGTTRLS